MCSEPDERTVAQMGHTATVADDGELKLARLLISRLQSEAHLFSDSFLRIELR